MPPPNAPDGRRGRPLDQESPPTDPTAASVTQPLDIPRGPKAHKEMARQLGIRGNSAAKLIVLAPDNDPFYKGTTAHYRDAEWFTGIWEQFGYRSGVHLRRVHYQILSNELKFADGTPYENTENYWGRLCGASAAARILGLVDVEAFDDRRNPDP